MANVTSLFAAQTTKNDNSQIAGSNSLGSASPNTLDDHNRNSMAFWAKYLRDVGGANTVGGTADAITITSASGSIPAYFDGMRIAFRAGSDNTLTTTTANIDAIGAKTIKKALASDGAEIAIAAGDIQAGGTYELIYRSAWASAVGAFQLIDLNHGAAGGVSASDFTADGDFLVGTGSGTYAAESGATARASMGTPIGLQTQFIPAGSMIPAITSGPAPIQLEASTNKHNSYGLAFDASADENADFEYEFPKSYDGGAIYFKPHWTTSATDADGVAWALKAVAVADGEPKDVAYGTAVVVTDDAQTAAYDELVTALSAAVTIAGTPGDGKTVQFRIFRDVSDANDDMTEDAILLGVTLLYNTDTTRDD